MSIYTPPSVHAWKYQPASTIVLKDYLTSTLAQRVLRPSARRTRLGTVTHECTENAIPDLACASACYCHPRVHEEYDVRSHVNYSVGPPSTLARRVPACRHAVMPSCPCRFKGAPSPTRTRKVHRQNYVTLDVAAITYVCTKTVPDDLRVHTLLSCCVHEDARALRLGGARFTSDTD